MDSHVVLDSKSISTTSQCAFESKGIIYYVNTQGVWATNMFTVTKLSAVIDDQWFLAKGPRVHCISPYEDGMVVSIAKRVIVTTTTLIRNLVKPSTLSSILLDGLNGTSIEQTWYLVPTTLPMIWSMTDKIPTYLNADPTVYVLGSIY